MIGPSCWSSRPALSGRLQGRPTCCSSSRLRCWSRSDLARFLRILTIVSAITLPLGLIAGLLGMNVGGVPGTTAPYGFLVVVLLMAAITALEFRYFRRKGLFD